MATSVAPSMIDGRRARGERTRVKVLDALLDLVGDGELRPTASQVADRAGVALRTVYHHFDDVEALRQTALEAAFDRHYDLLSPVDADLDLDDRIATLARQLRKLYEAIAPIRRATAVDELVSADLGEELKRSRKALREHIETVFSPEFSRHGDARTLGDAAETICSWPAWEVLRSGMGRNAAAAERTVSFGLSALFTKIEPRRRR